MCIDPIGDVDRHHCGRIGIDHERHRQHRQHRDERQHEANEQRAAYLRKDDVQEHAPARSAKIAPSFDLLRFESMMDRVVEGMMASE